MIVRKVNNQAFQMPKRESLPGKGWAIRAENKGKDFDQYLLEAFQGDLVKDGSQFSQKLSPLARENLIRLSQG